MTNASIIRPFSGLQQSEPTYFLNSGRSQMLSGITIQIFTQLNSTQLPRHAIHSAIPPNHSLTDECKKKIMSQQFIYRQYINAAKGISMWQTDAQIITYKFASQDVGPPNTHNPLVLLRNANTSDMHVTVSNPQILIVIDSQSQTRLNFQSDVP